MNNAITKEMMMIPRELILRAALEKAFVTLGRAGGNTINSPYRAAWEKARDALQETAKGPLAGRGGLN